MEEELEIDIGDIKHAYEKLQEVMNDLSDVEGIPEELLDNINYIAESINDLRINKEAELEKIQDEEYFEEQKTQWEKEQKEQEREYWNSVI